MTQKEQKNTKELILQSALELFSKKGYNNVSVAEICKKAGTNVASVNYHYKSKENLFEYVLAYCRDVAMSKYPMKNDELKTAEEKFQFFFKNRMNQIFAEGIEGNFYKIIAREHSSGCKPSKDLFEKFIKQEADYIETIIYEIAEKELDRSTLGSCIVSTMSSGYFFSQHPFIKEKMTEFTGLKGEALVNKITPPMIEFALSGIKALTQKER
jgi:AcrR family transcriptional regulator